MLRETKTNNEELDTVSKDHIEEMWFEFMQGFVVQSTMREKFYYVIERYMKGEGGVPLLISEEEFKEMSVMVQELYKFADRAPTDVIKGIVSLLLTGMIAIKVVENRGLVTYHNRLVDRLVQQFAMLNRTSIDDIKEKYLNDKDNG